MIIINGTEDLCGISSNLLDVGSVEDIMKEIDLATVLCAIRKGKNELAGKGRKL
jgi:hypothetical protein